MSPRGWSVALVAAVLLAAAAVPGAAVAQTPDQTINAQTDPKDAAAALNSGCADNINNCTLADISLTNGYSTPQILGDVLYNCAPIGGPDAYTGTSVSDTRGETTSLSESVSVTLQGGLIGIASASAEFKAFSSQSQGWTTTVTQTTSITVPPGYKGYTTTQVPTVNATAAYYVTDGIHLIDVTNVDLSYPYPNASATGNGNNTFYNLITVPIEPLYPSPIHPGVPNGSYQGFAPCTGVSDAPDTTVVGSGLGGVQQTGRFEFTLCKPGGRCVHHSLRGAPPPKVRRATAVLARGARTYAAGTDIGGHIRLTERRKITAGTYYLTIKQKPKRFKERRNGGRLAEQRAVIRVPIKVCGNSPSAGPRFGNPCTNAKT
jgi:hypothetical protein